MSLQEESVRETKVRYEEMLPDEVVAAREKRPVAYLPIGGIEWHGEHNVLGLDTVKAHALAVRCAESGGGLVFPALFYGEPREHYLMEANHDADGQIKNVMRLPPDSFTAGYMEEQQTEADLRYVQLLLHVLKEIRSLGFKVIAVLAGHYPLIHHARTASDIFNLHAAGKATAWAAIGYELVKDALPNAGDHAAAWETSLMMALRPELVDLSRLPKDQGVKLVGVFGQDPRVHASKEYGERGVELMVERVNAKTAELLKALGQ